MIGYGFSPKIENKKKAGKKAQKETAYIVFHIAEKDNVYKMLPKLTWRQTLIIIKGLAAALHYMHEENFRHGDVKLANVLMTKEGIPKLCDFGNTRNMNELDQYDRPALTPGFADSYCRNDESSLELTDDVYSFGIAILHLLTEEPNDKNTKPTFDYWGSVKNDFVAGSEVAHSKLKCYKGFSEETVKMLFGLAIQVTNSRGDDAFSRKGMDVIVAELEQLDVPEEDAEL